MQDFRLSDCHVHTMFSGDSMEFPDRQIERAIELGMKQLCITDHHDYDVVSDIDFELDLPVYREKIRELQKKWKGQIDLRYGIELGLQMHIREYLQDVVTRYPFDYVIGSIHFVDTLDPYEAVYFEGRTEEEAYRRFFEVTKTCIENMDCYDVLGHLDYVVRYGPNRDREYSYERYQDLIDPVLKRLVETGKGLECNTAGIRKGLRSMNPCEEILKAYKAFGGEIITVGSDAHERESLGYAFDTCRDLLKACGFRYYSVYKDRKPEFYPL